MGIHVLRIGRVAAILLMGLLLVRNLTKAEDSPEVTLLILGSNQCLNCRLLEPILNNLKEEYKGRVTQSYIDVRVNRDQARAFRLRRLPTLIVYNSNQRPIFRHEGFIDHDSLAKALDKAVAMEERGK